MIRNILILIYIFVVLAVSAKVHAAVTVTNFAIEPQSNKVFVEGYHDFQGNVEIVPRIINVEGNKVLIDMEPTCGRSCRPSQEKPYASLFDINELNLPAGQRFELYIVEAGNHRFLGSFNTGSMPIELERERFEGLLVKQGDRIVLKRESDNIYLSFPQPINVDQFLNKVVEISGFKNNFDGSDFNFYVLSIAENNIL